MEMKKERDAEQYQIRPPQRLKSGTFDPTRRARSMPGAVDPPSTPAPGSSRGLSCRSRAVLLQLCDADLIG